MQLKRVSVLAAMAVLAGLTSTLGPVASASADDPTVNLSSSIADFGQMVASPTHLFFTAPSALFQSGAKSEDQVVVTDLDGNNAASIANEPGAAAMVLSKDGSTLYVARSKDSSIAVIDTTAATPAETAHYALGDGVTPTSVAVIGSTVWFGYAKGTEYGLGSLDLSGATPVVTLNPIADAGFAPVHLKAYGTSGLVLADGDQSGSWVRSYDVSSGAPVVGKTVTRAGVSLAAMDITSDGLDVVTGWDDNAFEVYDIASMTVYQAYPVPKITDGTKMPTSLAVGDDGVLAVGVQGGDVHTFAGGELRSFGIGGGVPAGAVAWSADQTHLYTVTADSEGGDNPVLHVLSAPELATTTLNAASPASAVPGQQFTVSGTLASGWGAWDAGITVSVSRDGTVLDAAVPVNGDGSYSFADTPPTAADGTVYHYTVSYAGDAKHAAVQASAQTTVSRVATTVTLTAPSTAVPGRALTATGFVNSGLPLASGQTVAVTRNGQPFQTVPVQADGSYSFADTPAAEGSFSYAVSYAGDAAHLASASAPANVVASRLNTVVSSYSATAVGRTHGFTVSGSLSGSPYTVGELVKVVKTDAGHPSGYVLTNAKVAADGSFSFGDVPQIAGANSYSLSYAGDVSHKPGSKVFAVNVLGAATSLSVTTDARYYSYAKAAKVTVHLGTTYNSRKVALYAGSRLIKSGNVDSHGNLTAYWTLGSSTMFKAVYAGDWRYAPATAAKSVGTYVRLNEKLVGSGGTYYGSTTSGGHVYRLYHHNVMPGLYVQVSPNKAGRSVEFQLQVYYQGTWQSANPYDTYLAGPSIFTLYEGGLYFSGHRYPFRMRAVYSGAMSNGGYDSTNMTTAGDWQYFMVVK